MIKDENEKDIEKINLEEKSDSEMLKDVFFDKIIPLLQEYFYGDYEKIRLVLGDGFFEEQMKTTNVTFAVNNPDIPDSIIYHLKLKDNVKMADALKSMNILNWKDKDNSLTPQQPSTIQPSETETLENVS